jgi:hypothetical protein
MAVSSGHDDSGMRHFVLVNTALGLGGPVPQRGG